MINSPAKAKLFKIVKASLPSVVFLALAACGPSSQSQTTVSGYDLQGASRLVSSAKVGAQCSAGSTVGAYFAARCEDSGFNVIVSDQCETLCSGPAEL